jgi:hypothetical protein
MFSLFLKIDLFIQKLHKLNQKKFFNQEFSLKLLIPYAEPKIYQLKNVQQINHLVCFGHQKLKMNFHMMNLNHF